MHKLVILIEKLENWQDFESRWSEFLHLVETLPGLQREATSRVEHFLYGKTSIGQMHELFFNNQAEAEQALTTPSGQAAGRLLQQITGGRLLIFFAEHKEDDLENIRKFKPTSQA